MHTCGRVYTHRASEEERVLSLRCGGRLAGDEKRAQRPRVACPGRNLGGGGHATTGKDQQRWANIRYRYTVINHSRLQAGLQIIIMPRATSDKRIFSAIST